MAVLQQVLLIVAIATSAWGQRPFFAGSRPIGYPEVTTASTTTTGNLGNRFGEADSSTTSTTTQRLPIEANGDKELVDRLSKLPIDKQPFWFINWQAYEANRQKPQTYPIRPSHFALPLHPVNNEVANVNTPNINNSNFGSPSTGPALGTRISEFPNTVNAFSQEVTANTEKPVEYTGGQKITVLNPIRPGLSGNTVPNPNGSLVNYSGLTNNNMMYLPQWYLAYLAHQAEPSYVPVSSFQNATPFK